MHVAQHHIDREGFQNSPGVHKLLRTLSDITGFTEGHKVICKLDTIVIEHEDGRIAGSLHAKPRRSIVRYFCSSILAKLARDRANSGRDIMSIVGVETRATPVSAAC